MSGRIPWSNCGPVQGGTSSAAAAAAAPGVTSPLSPPRPV